MNRQERVERTVAATRARAGRASSALLGLALLLHGEVGAAACKPGRPRFILTQEMQEYILGIL